MLQGAGATFTKVVSSIAASVVGSWASSQVMGYNTAETRARLTQAIASGLAYGASETFRNDGALSPSGAVGNDPGPSMASTPEGVDWSRAPNESEAESARLERLNNVLGQIDEKPVPVGDGYYRMPDGRIRKWCIETTEPRIVPKGGSAAGLTAPASFADGPVIERFLASQRIDSRIIAITPRGLTRVDGGPVTYSFNLTTKRAY